MSIKLNIGGGYKRFEGFKNVDFDPLTNPDYCVNLETGTFPIEDSTVSEVKAHHILEHIGVGFFHLIQELYRICENGAIIDIRVPHHRHEIFYGDASHIRPITVEMLRQFSKKYNEYHIGAFNSSSGFGLRLNVDFEIVEYDFIPDDIWKARFPKMTQEEIMEVSRNFNNVYGETWIKLVVVK
jgi:hypothetical protein